MTDFGGSPRKADSSVLAEQERLDFALPTTGSKDFARIFRSSSRKSLLRSYDVESADDLEFPLSSSPLRAHHLPSLSASTPDAHRSPQKKKTDDTSSSSSSSSSSSFYSINDGDHTHPVSSPSFLSAKSHSATVLANPSSPSVTNKSSSQKIEIPPLPLSPHVGRAKSITTDSFWDHVDHEIKESGPLLVRYTHSRYDFHLEDFENHFWFEYSAFEDRRKASTPIVMMTELDKDSHHVSLQSISLWEDYTRIKRASQLPHASHHVFDFLRRHFWIDVCHPTPQVFQDLEKIYGVHPLTIEDLMSADNEREKAQYFEGYIYVHIQEREYLTGTNHLDSSSLHLLIFPDLIITLHNSDFHTLSTSLYRLKFQPQKLLTASQISNPVWTAYVIIEVISNQFYTRVNDSEEEVKALDNLMRQINLDSHPSFVDRMGNARHAVQELQSSVLMKQGILVHLLSRGSADRLAPTPEADKNIRAYFSDVSEEFSALGQRLESIMNLLQSVYDNYKSNLGFQSSLKEQKMNDVMSRFAAFGTILLPLGFVGSLWGMNVIVPGQEWPGGLLWFILIVVALLIFSLWCSLYFRMRRLL